MCAFLQLIFKKANEDGNDVNKFWKGRRYGF